MDETRTPDSPETRQRIIDAAVEIGSRLGYAKATTRAIAQAAGVNEVTLFRHFGSKRNLFAEAIEQYGAPALVQEVEARLSGQLEEDLLLFGRIIFGALLKNRQVMQFLLCESANIPEVREVLARNPYELRAMLARYFARQMETGMLTDAHPGLLAQAFMGMFFSNAISLTMLDSTIQPPVSDEAFIQGCVGIFLRGTLKQDSDEERAQ